MEFLFKKKNEFGLNSNVFWKDLGRTNFCLIVLKMFKKLIHYMNYVYGHFIFTLKG